MGVSDLEELITPLRKYSVEDFLFFSLVVDSLFINVENVFSVHLMYLSQE